MPDPMDSSIVEKALRRLGAVVEYPSDIEVLLVGGAAGMITGVLPTARVTTDCDVMVCIPGDAMAAVESGAERVAKELGLAPNWLNSDVQLRVDTLADGWERRKISVGTYGRLWVWAASRPDLIAMKVLAGREQDIEDLAAMRVRRDDVEFVRSYLDTLGGKGTAEQQINDAVELLTSLEIHDHE